MTPDFVTVDPGDPAAGAPQPHDLLVTVGVASAVVAVVFVLVWFTVRKADPRVGGSAQAMNQAGATLALCLCVLAAVVYIATETPTSDSRAAYIAEATETITEQQVGALAAAFPVVLADARISPAALYASAVDGRWTGAVRKVHPWTSTATGTPRQCTFLTTDRYTTAPRRVVTDVRVACGGHVIAPARPGHRQSMIPAAG